MRFRIELSAAVWRGAVDLCGSDPGATGRLNAVVARLLSDRDLISRTLDIIASEAARNLVDTA